MQKNKSYPNDKFWNYRKINNPHTFWEIIITMVSSYPCGSVVVSKHGLYAGSPGSIPTAVTTMTAAGGDAEHVSFNHWLASPYQGVKLGLAKT